MKKGILVSAVALALVFGGCGKKAEEVKQGDSTKATPGTPPAAGNPTTTIMFNGRAASPIKFTTRLNPTVVFFSAHTPAGTAPTDSIFKSMNNFQDSTFYAVVPSGSIYTIPGSAMPVYYRMYVYYNTSNNMPPMAYDTTMFYLQPAPYYSLFDGAFFKAGGGYSMVFVSDTYNTMQALPVDGSQGKK